MKMKGCLNLPNKISITRIEKINKELEIKNG